MRTPILGAAKSLTIASLAKNYQFVECRHCHKIQPLTNMTELKDWKFDLTAMLIRSPLLGVAVGICPYCDKWDREFRDLEKRLKQ